MEDDRQTLKQMIHLLEQIEETVGYLKCTKCAFIQSDLSVIPSLHLQKSGESLQPTIEDQAQHGISKEELLIALREKIGDCTRCKLSQNRTKLVFGVGNVNAELMFVGEGPGYDEDIAGLPFVGAAGQLLDRMIAAMGAKREDVYIANVVKCHPPGNRNPEEDEMEICMPFLAEQIKIISPKCIVALGKIAAQTLLNTKRPISKIRGIWGEYAGIPVMPTFHPAYLLRSPNEKRNAWEDLKAAMLRLGWTLPFEKEKKQ